MSPEVCIFYQALVNPLAIYADGFKIKHCTISVVTSSHKLQVGNVENAYLTTVLSIFCHISARQCPSSLSKGSSGAVFS